MIFKKLVNGGLFGFLNIFSANKTELNKDVKKKGGVDDNDGSLASVKQEKGGKKNIKVVKFQSKFKAQQEKTKLMK